MKKITLTGLTLAIAFSSSYADSKYNLNQSSDPSNPNYVTIQPYSSTDIDSNTSGHNRDSFFHIINNTGSSFSFATGSAACYQALPSSIPNTSDWGAVVNEGKTCETKSGKYFNSAMIYVYKDNGWIFQNFEYLGSLVGTGRSSNGRTGSFEYSASTYDFDKPAFSNKYKIETSEDATGDDINFNFIISKK